MSLTESLKTNKQYTAKIKAQSNVRNALWGTHKRLSMLVDKLKMQGYLKVRPALIPYDGVTETSTLGMLHNLFRYNSNYIWIILL